MMYYKLPLINQICMPLSWALQPILPMTFRQYPLGGSGGMAIFMMTGVQLVSPCLMMPNSWSLLLRLTTSHTHLMEFMPSMSSLTPLMPSGTLWMCLTTLENCPPIASAMLSFPGDKHSHAVHHRAAHLAHSMFTQTLPFANLPRLSLSTKAALSLGASPSALLTVNQGLAELCYFILFFESTCYNTTISTTCTMHFKK
jgi:hypothetical protein